MRFFNCLRSFLLRIERFKYFRVLIKIDWENRRLEVIAEKTGRRIVPTEPELYELLLEAFSGASEGQKLVIPKGSLVRSNLWRDFGVIYRRAGLKRWAKWCQVLRKNCETNWAQKYPQYAVSD